MSLNVDKLEKARKLANGIIQARCPACAENDNDRTGEHLRIYPDGRFGCCVYPKDKAHRRRIFALAGEKQRFEARQLKVKVAGRPATAVPARSIRESLQEFRGTLGTGKTESVSGRVVLPENPGTLGTGKSESKTGEANLPEEFGTLGTGIFQSRAYAREDTMHVGNNTHMCKDWEKGVPSVPSGEGLIGTPKTAEKQETAGEATLTAEKVGRLPYLTPGGTLVIPWDSPERYHWWKMDGERLSVDQTHAEVLQRMAEEKTKG
jgi:hypothetical protein